MKKEYTAPEMEIQEFKIEDIMASGGGIIDPGTED